MELYELSAHELHRLIENKEVSIEEVVSSIFQHIRDVEDKIGAFLSLDEEGAIHQAKKWNKRISQGEQMKPLTGIPIAIKDLICVEKGKTTCASRILKRFYPPYSATVIEKLKKEGEIGRAHV